MILIVDYDMGNVGSIKNILYRIGAKDVAISNSIEDILKADKYILPGVGSFDTGMNNLKELGIIDCLSEQVLIKKKPILGICLGMQLMGEESEEGQEKGLGWIPFKNVRFNLSDEYRIPHMGWNYVTIEKANDKIVSNLNSERQRYYFVHSYHAECNHEQNVLMTSTYGYKFAAAVVNDNIYGVQFHPEKSHKFGMKLFENFVEL